MCVPRATPGAARRLLSRDLMTRFLFASVPAAGHVTPGIPLSRSLVARGHEVFWYTGERFRSAVEASGASFVPMRANRDFDHARIDDEFPGRAQLQGLAQLEFDMMHLFIDAAYGCVLDLEAFLAEQPIDVLVNDVGCLGVPMLSERTGIPCATYGMSILPMPSRDTAPFGLALAPSSTPLGRVRNQTLNWAMENVLFKQVGEHYRATRARLGLPVQRDQGFFAAAGQAPYLYLQAGLESFEYPRSDLPATLHFCGPFVPEPSADFTPPAWWRELLSARSVVHVTQGTFTTGSEDLIVPTLRALAEEDVLVVATTGGKPVDTIALDPLPENVRVERFIPHAELLPHVDVMLTNAGYGGVQAALAHGVPLVAAGTTEDKPEVARRIAWSGVGIDLRTRRPTAKQIRRAVREILSDGRYRAAARSMQREIVAVPATTRAVALLEQLAATRMPVIAQRSRPAQSRAEKRLDARSLLPR
jgi:MGT family glycosyltransferase